MDGHRASADLTKLCLLFLLMLSKVDANVVRTLIEARLLLSVSCNVATYFCFLWASPTPLARAVCCGVWGGGARDSRAF
jgi:hypothetical protein